MDKKMNMVGLTRNNSTWAYVRSVPKPLQSHPTFKSKKNYRRQLGSTEIGHEELVKRWKQAHDDFENYIKTLKNLNTTIIEKNSLIEQAERFLRINGLSPSMLAASSEKADQYKVWTYEQAIEQSGIFDELFDNAAKQAYREVNSPHPLKDELSPTLKIQEQAWRLLNEPLKESYKQHLFSDCWQEYEAKKGIDTSSRNGKRIKACFDSFVKLVGDRVLDEKLVNDALVKYVEIREERRAQRLSVGGKASPSPASISRELNTLLAVLRVGCKRFRVSMHISRPDIREDIRAKERHTFSTQEQISLINAVSDQSRNDYQPYKELMILLMVQTGTHISELIRLKRNKVMLDTDIPHLIFDGELKTSQRKRVVPLVFRVERIKALAALFNDSSDYFFGTENVERTTDNYSAQLNKLCREINPESTSYSCRHAFKHLAYVKGIDAQILAILGGWSGKETGLSRQMQGYGKSGLMNEESLRRLEHSMHLINGHLIEEDSCRNEASNLSSVKSAVVLPLHPHRLG